jgi:GTP cyclohydrolase III
MPDYATVADLFARYAAAMDDNDFDVLRDVFTERSSFTVDITGGPTVGPFTSRDATVEFIQSTTEGQQDQRRHVITNVRTEGDTAYAILSLFVTANGELSVQTTGVYKCELGDEAGKTRFASLYLTLDRPY